MRARLVLAGFLAVLPWVGGAAWAAQPELEPGNWKLQVSTTTNGKPEPVQSSQECLGDELKDLASYFAPELEGVKAKCSKQRRPSKDPRQMAFRTRCAGGGFTSDIDATVTTESSRHFTATMRINSRTRTEAALVVANVEGRWAGACTPAAKQPATK